MSENTNIEWADSTFNPWVGCTKISPACDNCYAERDFDQRRHFVKWGAGQPRRRTSVENWRKPPHWNRVSELKHKAWALVKAQYPTLTEAELQAQGFIKPRRPRVFCASLADVFDNEVDPKWQCDLFDLIRATPYLDWLLLTKRIGNAKNMPGANLQHLWPVNVWLGITVVNQDEADRDIPKLLAVPAAKRFLSIEPMLGPIDLTAACANHRRRDADGVECVGMLRELDWVIVGGETGPGSRPMHPDWARSIRDQCQAARVPFFFKQWGEYIEWDGSQSPSPSARMNDMTPMVRIGKRKAGRLLDGREWNEVPA